MPINLLKNVKVAPLASSQKNGLATRNERSIVDRDDADDGPSYA